MENSATYYLFAQMFDELAEDVHLTAVEKGWWEDNRSKAECIALMHSELSEALEALRKDNPPDDKLPRFFSETVELADLIIRVMDYAGRYELPLGEAIIAKVVYNTSRPKKHGKKF